MAVQPLQRRARPASAPSFAVAPGQAAIAFLRRFDLVLLGSALLLTVIGLVMVYSATRYELVAEGLSARTDLEHQMLYAVLGIVMMVVVALIDYRNFETFGYVIYGVVTFMLLAVLVPHIGSSALGAQRWFELGPIQLQPSEFGALGLVIAIATYLSRHQGAIGPREFLVLLVLVGVPMLLVVKQPDLSTAILMGVVLAAMLVIGGVPLRYLAALVVIIAVAALAAVELGFLHKYQIDRLTGFLHQNKDILGVNYNLHQSLVTIGSGGATGTGLFHGTQTNTGSVPEQYTDFIFTAVGEQLGFLGSVVVLGLFGVMAMRLLAAARMARDNFGRLVCAGALAFLVFSVFENVGMTIGIMPIGGIPLPFVSYGGSALFAFFVMVGVVMNVELRSRQAALL
jgi:rod shape determining protein RodA